MTSTTPPRQEPHPRTRNPGVGYSLVTVGVIIGVLVVTLLVLDGPLPLAMFVGFLVAIPFGLAKGRRYDEIETASFNMMLRGLTPTLILVSVGALISAWILSGTVPALIWLGLQTIQPQYFLPAAILLCIIASLVNGTNWGTMATIGLALMGVAIGLGIPAGVAAGAIITGATFGDKMSPLSDTTVMAVGLSDAKLIPHIRHMLWTSLPALLIAAGVFTWMGLGYALDPAGVARISEITSGIEDAYTLGLVPYIPPVLVFGLLVARKPAFPSIAIGAVVGAIIAVFYQGREIAGVLDAMWSGYTAPEELGFLGELFSGGTTGGALNMLGLASIVLFALGIAGVLQGAGMLDALLNAVSPKLDTTSKLVPFTLGLTLFLNAVGAAVNFAAAMGATLARPLFRRHNLAPKNLSRAVQDVANTTGPLIPWNATAIFTVGVLDVPLSVYIPFCFYCFLNVAISLGFGLTGFNIPKATADDSAGSTGEPRAQHEQERASEDRWS